MTGPALVANARMYAVTPAVEASWADLFDWAGREAGVPLAYRAHPAPAPLDELWARDDLGLAFMCGWPFANLYPAVRPVAAPVPAVAWAGGAPVYRTDFAARADRASGDALRGRVGWTAEHSQSGFHAPRGFMRGREPAAWVGPLVTPRRVVDAVLAGQIDAGPLDSYWLDLLRRYEPETAGRLRVVASTEPTPLPLLVASSAVDPDSARALAGALATAPASLLAPLLLSGFAPVGRERYRSLVAEAGSGRPAAASRTA